MRQRDQKIIRLRQLAAFAACSEHQLTLIGRLADEVSAATDQVIVSDGVRSSHCYVVASGLVELRGGRRCRAATLGPGSHFGEVGSILREPSAETVTALLDTRLLAFGSREFATLIDRVPAFRQLILHGMASRIVDVESEPVRRRPLVLVPGEAS